MMDYKSPFIYHAWLASALIPPDMLLSLLETYETPEAVYDAFMRSGDIPELMLPPGCRSRLLSQSAEERLRWFDDTLVKHGIQSFCFHDPIYPEQLRCISDPPVLLFYQGEPDCIRGRTVSVVGSRSASYAGQKATRKISKELSCRGVAVISGLASGIDTSAHNGCLDGSSPTIAVTACGLDRVYPSSSLSLRDDILDQGGLLISEYAPGEKPAGWHFPVRNRILTGLGHALILMEAKIRSGSMTSVRHALDQGKDVFVYPGDPASPYFEGNHQLLREGALYFTTAEDILEDLGWLDNPPVVRHNSGCPEVHTSLTKVETSVIQALTPGCLSFEELIAVTGITPAELLASLTCLQVKGYIESLPGKVYRIIAQK